MVFRAELRHPCTRDLVRVLKIVTKSRAACRRVILIFKTQAIIYIPSASALVQVHGWRNPARKTICVFPLIFPDRPYFCTFLPITYTRHKPDPQTAGYITVIRVSMHDTVSVFRFHHNVYVSTITYVFHTCVFYTQYPVPARFPDNLRWHILVMIRELTSLHG
jgi:hypothetical protein